MSNYSNFYLQFQLDGEGVEWLDYDLPYPHYLLHLTYSYIIAWKINGYFGSSASKEFLLDVVARFLLLFPNAARLPYKPTLNENAHIFEREAYELKEIAKHLPSLPWKHEDTKLASFVDAGIRKFNENKKEVERMVTEDALFEATRWHLYRRAYAEGTTDNITEDYVRILLETENQLLIHRKSPSDIRSKAKRMAEFMQNEFVIYDNISGYAEWSKTERNAYMHDYRRRKGLVMATREEHAKKIAKEKREKNRRAIINVMTGLYCNDYKKKNGAWHFGKIAEATGLSSKTVGKIIKEIEKDSK